MLNSAAVTDWERIKSTFEAKTTCHLKNRPQIHCEPGCVWIQCDRKDDCKCQIVGDSGDPLTPLLAEWMRKFS